MHDGREPLTLAQRVRAGEQLVGLIVKMPAAAIIEAAGFSGFDLVVIDTEHGAAETESLENHLRAAETAGVPALVRVGSVDGSEILRALDAGADGIVVPHVSGLEMAERAVSLAHYPPRGKRGLATSTRAGRHGLMSVHEHVRAAVERTLVVVQVEHADAIPQVEEIAKHDGVDAVFLGPTDLAISLGHPGETAHPTVVEAIDRIASAVVACDSAVLCVFVNDEDSARAWQQRGAGVVLFAAPGLIAAELQRVVVALRAPQPIPLPIAPPETRGD